MRARPTLPVVIDEATAAHRLQLEYDALAGQGLTGWLSTDLDGGQPALHRAAPPLDTGFIVVQIIARALDRRTATRLVVDARKRSG